MEEISGRRALEILIDIVDEAGEDFVYEKIRVRSSEDLVCAYFTDDAKPSCIVGHVLARAGLVPDLFVGRNTNWMTTAGELGTSVPQVSGEAEVVLQAAQSVQDQGLSWGAALNNARHAYERQVAESLVEGLTREVKNV